MTDSERLARLNELQRPLKHVKVRSGRKQTVYSNAISAEEVRGKRAKNSRDQVAMQVKRPKTGIELVE